MWHEGYYNNRNGRPIKCARYVGRKLTSFVSDGWIIVVVGVATTQSGDVISILRGRWLRQPSKKTRRGPGANKRVGQALCVHLHFVDIHNIFPQFVVSWSHCPLLSLGECLSVYPSPTITPVPLPPVHLYRRHIANTMWHVVLAVAVFHVVHRVFLSPLHLISLKSRCPFAKWLARRNLTFCHKKDKLVLITTANIRYLLSYNIQIITDWAGGTRNTVSVLFSPPRTRQSDPMWPLRPSHRTMRLPSCVHKNVN